MQCDMDLKTEDHPTGMFTEQEVFDMLNEQLIAELPQLLDLRVPFFDPSFEAMIRMQYKFAEEGYEKLSGVQRYFGDNVRDDYAAGQLDSQVCLDTSAWPWLFMANVLPRSRAYCRK